MQIVKYAMPYVAGFVLFGLWAALVFRGLADPQPLVDLLSATIGGAGVHVVHQTKKPS